MNQPLGPETLVNSITVGSQNNPSVTTLLDGSFVVVWDSFGQDGDLDGIVAQRYSAEGEELGLPTVVNTTGVDIQNNAQVAATEDGGYVVVWQSRNQDNPGDFDIGVFGQRFDAAGNPAGDEFQVNDTNVSRTQHDAEVAGVPGGGFAVVYVDDRGDSSNNVGVRMRLFDAAGTPLGTDFQVNSTTSSTQDQAAVAAIQASAGAGGLATGGLVVVYRDSSGALGSGSDILAQRYAPDGTPLGAEFIVNTTTVSTQDDPSVVSLTGGRFVVTWQDQSGADGSSIGIFAQVYEGDGTAVGSEFQINVETSSSQSDPEVTALDDGGFAVIWTSSAFGSAGDGSGQGVFARRFDADGVAQTGEFQVNEEISSTQNQPDIAALANGAFVGVWTSVTSGSAGDGDSNGVFLRLFGDPLVAPVPSASPEVEAVSTTVTFAEDTVNGTPQKIDLDGAVAVSDADSADFDGGRIILGTVAQTVSEDGFLPQDADEQVQLGLDTSGTVGVSGAQVSVGGTVVGTLSSDGQNGANLIITLNANADPAAVEVLLENLTFANVSDDPREQTLLQLQVEDGDGATSAPVVITVNVTPDADGDGLLGGERQTNTVTVGEQTDAQIAGLMDGGYLSVWTSFNQDNTGDGDSGVFGQRFDDRGVAVGSEFQINTTVTSSQFDASVAGLTDGGWVVVWDDDTISGVRLNRYDANGALVVTEEQVETNSSSNQFTPQVVGLSNGGYVVVWVSFSSGLAGDGSSNGVIAQLYNAAGARVGTEIVINQQTTGNQDQPQLTALQNGRFAVTWRESDSANGDGSSSSINMRLFDDAGVPEGGDIQVNSFTPGAQSSSHIATLDNGDIVVAWNSANQDGSSTGVYYQRFTDQGVPVGPEVRVNDSTSGSQEIQDIIALDTGGFVVSWVDTSTPAPGSGVDVFVQAFDADGTRIDSELRVNTEVSSTQNGAAMAALPDGNYVVQWRSETSGTAGDGSSGGIFHQIVGDPAEISQSAAPTLVGLEQSISVNEGDAEVGAQLIATGALSLSDSDSADFDGGQIRISRIVTEPIADEFNAPDDATQDNLSFATGGRVTQAGATLRVDGVDVGTIVSDGADGANLTVDLLAGSTVARIEALLNALTFTNDSDDPRDTRTYSLRIEDGDGGLTQPLSFELRVIGEAEANAPQAVGQEVLVNAFAPGNQENQHVATLNDGGWVVVWTSSQQDTQSTGVFAQRFDSEGVRVGGEFQVNTTEQGRQQDATVTALENGGFVIAWASDNVDGSSSDFGVVSQVYDVNGAPVGSETLVNITTSATQSDPSLATIASGTTGFPNGGYVVAYFSDSGDGSGDSLLLRRFETDGTPVGGEIVANGVTSGTQNSPEIAINASGLIGFTYFDNGDDIYVRFLNPDGTQAVADLQIEDGGAVASITALAGGGFVVAWQDNQGRDGSGVGIEAQRFDANGVPVGNNFIVNEVTFGSQVAPDVIGLTDGRFVVAWTDNSNSLDGSGASVVGQLFSAAGERIDSQFVINDEITLNSQGQPELAALPNGNFVATFTNFVNSGTQGDGSGTSVYQQIFGDPADFTPSDAPLIQGMTTDAAFSEDDVNGGFLRLDADATVALGDLDSPDFDGGVLTVEVDETFNQIAQLGGESGEAQDLVGLVNGDVGNGNVILSAYSIGGTVSVGGTVVGTVTSVGSSFSITFNSDASVEAVEAVLGNIAYSNISSAPAPLRRLSVDLSDGDGTSAQTQFINVTVSQDTDLPLVGNREERVNAHTENSQSSADVAELTGGGVVVVWESSGQDNLDGSQGVFAQLYDANGAPIGNEIAVNSTTAGAQSRPAVAATADGGFTVVWVGNNQDAPGSFDSGIIGQRFDASGVAQGGEFVVNTATAGTQFEPAISAFVDGGFVVTYRSDNGDGNQDAILSQRFDAAANTVGAEITVNVDNTEGDQSDPAVATLVNGASNAGHVIVFTAPTTTNDGDGDDAGLFLRVFDASGAALGADVQVNTSTAGSQSDASVVGLTGGGFVVVWTDSDGLDGASNGVFAQRFDNSGTPLGSEFRVNVTTINAQDMADVAALADGGFLVSWDSDGQDGSSTGIVAQRFDASGTRVDGEFQVNELIDSTQTAPSVTSFGTGFAAVWTSPTSNAAGDGSSNSVQIRTFTEVATVQSGPKLSDFERALTVNATDVTSGSLTLDDQVAFEGPTSGGFAGGSLELYYTEGETAFDQLSIATDAVISLSSNDLSFDGLVIGTIDGTLDGANGNGLLINFNANATDAAIKALVERISYESTDSAANVQFTERGIGVTITDANGRQTQPDSVFVSITTGVSAPPNIVVDDFLRPESEGGGRDRGSVLESDFLNTPQLIDANIDLDDNAGVGFDGGFVQIQEVFNSGGGQQLSVQDQGTGSGEIGLSGGTVSYEGTAIGSIDGSQDGVNGAALRINLNASATAEAVEALVEALTFEITSNLSSTTLGFDLTVNNGNGSQNSFLRSSQALVRDLVVVADSATEETQVNSFADGEQFAPRVAELSDGSYVVTWVSNNQDAPGSDGIFAQRYTAQGQELGAEFQVNDLPGNAQRQARVEGLSNDTFVVTWRDGSGADGSGQGIFGQVFDNDGTPLGGSFQVNEQTSSTQTQSEIVDFGAGRFMVVWSSASSAGAGDGSSNGIFGRTFDAPGTPEAGEFQINQTTSGNQNRPQVTELPGSTDVMVVWEGPDANGNGVFAQRVDTNGNLVTFDGTALAPAGAEVQINTVTTGNQQQPDIAFLAPSAALPNGGFVVVFASPDTSSFGIFARIYDVDGTPQGAEFQVNTFTSSDQSDPVVVGTPNGGFIVAINDFGAADGSGEGVLGQRFNADGSRDGPMFVINQQTSSTQDQPDLALLNNGGIVTVWRSVTSGEAGDGSGSGVFQTILDAAAVPAGAGAPVIEGFEDSVTFDENTVNAAPQILNQDGALSITDADSVDLDGGTLLVQRLVGDQDANETQRGASEGAFEDQLSIVQGNGVTLAGNTVSVDGTAIGTIVQDGVDGAPLEISLSGAGATPEAVEAVLAQLGYANASDDPEAVRQFTVQLLDGDGGSSGNNIITVAVTAEEDLTLSVTGGEEQVNTFTPSNQIDPATSAIFDASGVQIGYVVVWESNNQDRTQDSSTGIFGQVYDLDGTPQGSEFLVNTHTEFSQSEPTVTGLPTGGFVVGWTDGSGAHPAGVGVGENNTGVFAQIYDHTGAPQGATFLVNDVVSSSQRDAAFAAASDGTIVAVYSDDSGADGSGTGVFMRRFDDSGTALGASVQVNTETSSTQDDAAVTILTGGRIVVTWTSATSASAGDGDDSGVFARLFEADGTPVGAEFQVNTNVVSRQDMAKVAALSDGGFVVVYENFLGDGSGEAIYQQRFDVDGNPVGGEVLVNDVTSSWQSVPDVIALDGGGWVVAFSDFSGSDGSGEAVRAQVYAADGSRVDGSFLVNEQTSGSQNQVALVSLPGGGFTAVWVSAASGSAGDGHGTGVFQRLFEASASVPGSGNPILNSLSDVSFDEADVNAGGQIFAPTLGLGDFDSANFDGGELIIGMVLNDTGQPQFAAPDDLTQDNLSFDQSGAVSIAGTSVSVDGTAIGTLVSDGADGADLVVGLNADATPDRLQTLLRNATYANDSDDPETARLISITVNDGDGGSARETLEVTITPEQDGAERVGTEVQTNSFTTGSQSMSHVAELTDGGYVIVWTSTNQDATGDNNTGVFAQRYDSTGAPVGGEFQVNTNAQGGQTFAEVVGLSTGGFAVSWRDDSSRLNTLSSTAEIVTQVYDANGTKVGGEVAAPDVGDVFTSADTRVALDAFGDGDFVQVYEARNESAAFQTNIVVQRYNDQGGTDGLPSIISPIGGESAFDADVAVQSDGTFMVSFTSNGLETGTLASAEGVFIQRFAADGSQVGGPIQVNTQNVRSTQSDSRIAATEDGGYVVTYTSSGGDDGAATFNLGVYAQRFDGAGNPIGDNFLVNEVVDSSQFDSDVVGLTGGGFVVTFTDNSGTDGSGQGVFAQQYDANGHRVDGALQVNTAFSNTQGDSAVAALANGNFVVSFSSNAAGAEGDGSGDGIFHQILGDPADFSIGGAPVLEGINETVTYDENTVNGIPQLIDANGAAAVSDPDSADFDGGSILVSQVVSSAPLIDQINAPDDLTQDQLGLRQGSQITISGTAVSVDGTQVATIVQDGQDGRAFELSLNTAATAAIVELLVENLTYRNISDDPLPERVLRIQVTDGDGGASEPVVVTVSITPTPDAAQPRGGEVTVNDALDDADNIELVQLPGTGGDFIAVYELNPTDGSGHGIYAQRFDVQGNKLARDGSGLASGQSDEFRLNTTTTQDQFEPQVAAFSDGSWVAVWTDDSLDGSSQGIVFQRFNEDGTPAGGETVANTGTTFDQDSPAITVLSDDKFVVTWDSGSSGGAGDGNGLGVLARVFNSDGTAFGAQFVVNTNTASTQDDPSITALNDGGFLIAWESSTGDVDGFGVFAQRYDASGAVVGGEFRINTSTLSNQIDVELTVLDNGNVVAVWTDNVADLSGDGVFATVIAPDGTTVVEEFRVNDQRIGGQFDPVVASLDTGGFVIAWTDNNGTDGSGQGVFAQQYSADGARVDSQFLVNSTTSGTQNQPSVEGLPGGGFIVGWNGSVMIQVYGNDTPSISPVSASGDEDTAIVLDAAVFDAGFSDPDGNTLQAIRIDTFPTNGTLALNGTPVTAGQEISRADLLAGNLVYTGNQDYNGSDSFLWTGSDGLAFSTDPSVAANITVNPVNDAPGLEAGADVTLAEGASLNRTLTLTDPDVQTRSYMVDFGDGNMASFNSDLLSPSISNAYAAEGTYTVTVTVDDGAGAANSMETDTFTVTVENAAPNAVNDTRFVSEDDGATTLADPLGNDSDPGGDPITVTNVAGVDSSDANFNNPITLPSGAILTFTAGGDFIYDPNGQFESLPDFQNASDSFTYTITDDGGLSDTATVTISIDGQNDDPTAQDDSIAASDTTATNGNVLDDNGNGADSDVDTGNTLTVIALDGEAADIGVQVTLSSGALLTLNSDGTFTYDSNGQFPAGGTDTFDYTLSDGRGGTDTATVTLNILSTIQPPVAQDDSLSADEDTISNGSVLADNGNGADSDPNGDPLTVTEVNGNAANVGNAIALSGGGTVTVQSTGAYTFNPNGGYEDLAVGEDATESFTYTISDGTGGTDTATATITIAGVNDAPVASNDTNITDEDTPLSSMGASVLDNDSDADTSDTLRVSEVDGSSLALGTSVTGSGGGTFVINSDGTYTYDPGSAFNSLRAGQTGFDTIGYTVTDDNGGSDTGQLSITINGVNDAPVAQDDLLNVGEDAILLGDLTVDNGNGPDLDPDTGDIPFVSLISLGGMDYLAGQQITLSNGALLTVNGSGTFTFDTNGAYQTLTVGQSTDEVFTYTIQDGSGATDTASVTITINGNDDQPIAIADNATTNEDNSVSGNVLTNDTDADGDTLTVSAVNGEVSDVGSQITLPSGALLTLNPDGSFDYDPNDQFETLAVGDSTSDSFDYTVSDGRGGTDTTTATVTITGVNDAPVAGDDTFNTNEDSGLIPGLDLFINNGGGVDSDIDAGDLFTITEVNGQSADVGMQITLGSGALLTVNADGSASYDPNGVFNSLSAGQTGIETFTYTIDDGNGGTDTGNVQINIAGVNDAPDAVDDGLSVAVGAALNGNVFDDNGNGPDSDPDQLDSFGVIAVNGQSGDVGTQIALTSGALLTLNNDGTFSYDQNGAFAGLGATQSATDTFDYTISDGNGGTDTATVTVTIGGNNQPPVAQPDSGLGFATDEDTAFTTASVLANDSDPNVTDTLTVSSFDTTGTTGSVTNNGDGTFDYDPNSQFESLAVGESATDSFTYTVSDGNGGTDTETATITINGVNDAPDAVDDSLTTDEDSALLGDLLADNGSGADSDVDSSDTLTISEVNGVAANVGSQITLGSGALLTVNADGTFDYDPNGAFETLSVGQSGADSFTYTISDGNGGTDIATVGITINGVNDAPVAADDAITTDEDNAVQGDVFADNGNGADSDVDTTDSFGVSEVNGNAGDVGTQITLPSGTLLTLNADGTFSYDPNGQFESLAVGESDTDSFTYTIDDGNGGTDTATATVTIDGVNDAPVANDDSVTTPFQTQITVDVLANDTDVDTSDGTPDVTGILLVSEGAGTAVLLADDRIQFTPNAGFSGPVEIDYTISDGNGGTDTARLTITVAGPGNVPPNAVNDTINTDEDNSAPIALLSNDNDSDGGTLTLTEVRDSGGAVIPFGVATALPEGGTLTVATDGTGTYDPAGDFEALALGDTAMFTVSYDVSDGQGGSDTATVTINVAGVNDAPTAADDSLSTDEDTLLQGNVLNDNGNGADSDVDAGTVLNVTEVNGQGASVGTQITLPSGALLTLNSDGTFDYDPNGQFESLAVGENDSDSFTYTISDGEGGTDTATATITIDGVNDAPVAADDAISTDEDTAVQGDVFADNGNGADSDVDATDSFSVSAVNGMAASVGVQIALASGALLTLNADGTFDYDPNGQFESLGAGDTDTDSFTYTIDDGSGGTSTATATVTINGVNDAPVAADTTASLLQDTSTTIDVLSLATDAEGDILSIVSLSALNALTLSVDDRGTPLDTSDDRILYQPTAGFTGMDTITYEISDGTTTDVGTIMVTVTPNLPGIVGTAGNDRLVGTPQADQISGLAGNDTLVGKEENDILDGGADNDKLTGGDGDDELIGDQGDDRLTGGQGNDTLNGGDGNDVFYGDLTGSGLDGAMGADLFAFDMDDGVDRVFDFVAGIDRVQLLDAGNASFAFNASTGDTVMTYGTTVVTFFNANVTSSDVAQMPPLPAPSAQDDHATTDLDTAVIVDVLNNDDDGLGGLPGLATVGAASNGAVVINTNGTALDTTDDTITYTPNAGFVGSDSFTYTVTGANGLAAQATVTISVGSLDVMGTVGNDRLIGTAARENFDALGGNDLVRAGAAADIVNGGEGNDRLFGDDGDDVLNGEGDRDRIDGGTGMDMLNGGADNDRLYGGLGADTLTGGDGNDVMFGDIAGDRTAGALGGDEFHFDLDDGDDRIFDFVSGVDSIELFGNAAFTLTITGSGNSIIEFGATTITVFDEILLNSDIDVTL
ncbi:Ig-like domain-containing protein [Shimia sp. MMG029]|uniref:Ig-like domain-containing protein n=1 Tax=Shimia sp. MMG029 TaxID=3021978 RepID=UPI0022FE50E0|nr:Ig-like domain-containing protein [Shimia sp. MMG029]MDA5556024.1 Ig-like domain-containing protein [Shimia sp. MMG029]